MLITTVTQQRSGTKFFASLFATGTQVSPLGEIFLPDHDHLYSFHQYIDGVGYKEARKIPSDIVLDNFFEATAVKTAIKHFDLMFNQLEMGCISWNPYSESFMYGYLKARNALVVSLEREAADIYKSTMRVDAGLPSHFYLNEQHGGQETKACTVEISMKKLEAFASSLFRQRARLMESFRNYPFFFTLPYSKLAATGKIPDDLIEMIVACAE